MYVRVCALMHVVTESVVCVVPDVWTVARVNRRFLSLVNISRYCFATIYIC